MRTPGSLPSTAGFTAVEAIISTALFASLMGGFLMSFISLERLSKTTQVEYELVASSLRVLQQIEEVVARTGYTNVGGVAYPVIYGGLDELVPELDAFEGLPGLLFRMPADEDGDQWPDVTAAGEILWDDEIFGLVLVPTGDTASLELRSTAGERRVLARNVSNLRFLEPADVGFSIPLDSLQIELEIRERGPRGAPIAMESRSVVALRNGDLSQ